MKRMAWHKTAKVTEGENTEFENTTEEITHY